MMNKLSLKRHGNCQSKYTRCLYIINYSCDQEVLGYQKARSTDLSTRKRFSEKPIVAFTNSTVFILHVDFYIYH